ncbi:anti-lipopolysaccharide factor-like [Penaeus monodon]|uniref:anti-lipopolysaccharide factor-like n=1 Tax=Penaeus monodon TaxID=6687 RepID=UPI0018A768F6|nr:anti-lipopolysaccharide factor-like [Penaeus monodon]
MKPSVIITLLVLALAMQCIAKKKEQLINQVARELLGQWITKGVEFMGYPCELQVQPRFSFWTLYYQSSFFCTGWTAIKGEATARCRLGSAEEAVRDFIKKVIKGDTIRQIDVSKWFEEHKNVTGTP